MRRRGRSLEDDRARLTQAQVQRHRLCAARDGGRIIVTELSMLCLPVVAEMSRARWPSSPSARSCGCLHRESNAKAVSKTGVAARSHVPMASASCVARGGRRASRQARERTARVHLQHVHRSLACARSGRANRKLRALHARLPAGPGGTHLRWVGVPGLEEVGDKVDRGVDRLARALVPRRVYCDGCVWVLCARSGYGVECAAGLLC